jgi:hypothetical protein
MDIIALAYTACIIVGILFLWQMGVFGKSLEAIRYIREHGWSAYRKARADYDKYDRKRQLALPSKSERRDFQKQMVKQQKQRK